MKTPEKIREAAKERVTEINAGKVPTWTPLDFIQKHIYIGGFEEGYAQAVQDIRNKKQE